MKFHDFEDFLSQNGNSESEIERLRKAQAEIRRLRKRRLMLLAALILTVLSVAYLLANGNYKSPHSQPRGGNQQTRS